MQASKRTMMIAVAVFAVAMPGLAADTRSLADIKAGKRVSDAEAEAAAGEAVASTNAPDGKSRAKVPAGWLRGSGPSGYEKALELQTESGLDMLVLFYRENTNDEKGLLHWFEKKGMNEAHVLKQMRKYVKVQIDAAQNDSRTRELVKEYHVEKTPRLVVRRPDGHTKRVDVFTWPGGKPELVPPTDLVKDLKAASSPSYQTDEE